MGSLRIRRHYLDEASPLSAVLARYADFFGLFGDFRGYVQFFLLQDLVKRDFAEVRFFAPFEGFTLWPVPGTEAQYAACRARAIGFIEARNLRIAGVAAVL